MKNEWFRWSHNFLSKKLNIKKNDFVMILAVFQPRWIFLVIFFDLEKLDLSLYLDNIFFSCSNFSFLLIKSLLSVSIFLKLFTSNCTFRF